mgnify:CR=1 FL=1|tara:strand:+ start:1563 stop:1787 length:225 start_codon:yes stop_codon:yes gene_type:complete
MADQPTSLYLYLQDEAPRIGSGKRKVTVMSVGPKWVKLKYCKAKFKGRSITINHKLPRKTWDRLIRLHNKNETA